MTWKDNDGGLHRRLRRHTTTTSTYYDNMERHRSLHIGTSQRSASIRQYLYKNKNCNTLEKENFQTFEVFELTQSVPKNLSYFVPCFSAFTREIWNHKPGFPCSKFRRIRVPTLGLFSRRISKSSQSSITITQIRAYTNHDTNLCLTFLLLVSVRWFLISLVRFLTCFKSSLSGLRFRFFSKNSIN